MKSPNIVFIFADDMGYGDLGCYNRESRIPTPNMDALAARGMLFTDAHSSSAVCTPSRYGVLTGRYCWRTGLAQGVIGGFDPALIEPSRMTIASMLRDAGYDSACIGKWHVGLDFQDKDGNPSSDQLKIDFSRPITGGPVELGFDYAYINAGCGTCAPPYGFIENDRFIDDEFEFFEPSHDGAAGKGMMGKSWETREADVIITDKACEYIEQRAQDERPFFLYLAPNAPHEPCIREYVPEFARGKSEAGARGDLVWLFDWTVGRIMETLKSTGMAGETLVIVTSDNGALPGDFVRDSGGVRRDAGGVRREFLYETYGHASCGHWRGYKAHIWEGGHREPLIACWPGRIKAGTVSEEPVCLTDIMATCAEIAGQVLPADAAEDSCSMLPALLGDETAGVLAGKPLREALVHHSSFGVFSIRQGEWKLILDTEGSGGWPTPRDAQPRDGAAGQLYDIAADPAEAVNLWGARPDVVERLSGLLARYRSEGRSVPPAGTAFE